MAKCSRCNKRKAKRDCPALGYSICPLCCGLLRDTDINCPPECLHHRKHSGYQNQKTINRTPSELPRFSSENDPMKDERLAWLILQIEAAVWKLLEIETKLRDSDILISLRYARMKISSEKTILMPESQPRSARNESGEAILKSISECRYEGKIIIPGRVNSYSQTDKLLCLDRLILYVHQFLKENPESRGYLIQLKERFSRIRELSRTPRILSS